MCNDINQSHMLLYIEAAVFFTIIDQSNSKKENTFSMVVILFQSIFAETNS